MARDPFRRLRRHVVGALDAIDEMTGGSTMSRYGYRGDPAQYEREKAADKRYLKMVTSLSKSEDAEDLNNLLGPAAEHLDLDAASAAVEDARKELRKGEIDRNAFARQVQRALSCVPALSDSDVRELSDRLAKEPRLKLADALVQQLRVSDELSSPETEKAAWSARQGQLNYARDTGERAARDVPQSDAHLRAAQRLHARCPHLEFHECVRRVLNR